MASRPVTPGEPIAPFVPELEALIAEAMDEWKIPGLAIAVVQDGEAALVKAYGLRDVEAGLPVTTDTHFMICSITKSFTSTGLALLVDEQRLDWKNPVRDYIPEFRLHDAVATDRSIGALPDGEMMFHHDMLHAEVPHNATLLYSMEVPTHGGDTLFASGYAAYESLDPAIRSRLAGRNAIHHYHYGSTQRGDDRGVAAYGESVHPVFRTHDETGRKAIYVNRLMTVGIVDMPQEESEPLLNAVFDHSEKPEFVYTHVWRVGDLLVWDNRCSMHARTDFPSDQRRLMLRTTVKGTERPC